jgi:hypothetical protein
MKRQSRPQKTSPQANTTPHRSGNAGTVNAAERAEKSPVQERVLQGLYRCAVRVSATTRVVRVVLSLALKALCLTSTAHAQFVEDGLRFGDRNSILTARAAALGVGYAGVADDFAALYTNPAGLTLVPSTEITFGAQWLNNRTTANFAGSSTPSDISGLSFSHVGVVIPSRSQTGGFAFAFGLNREADFAERTTFAGFNPTSSQVQAWVRNQQGRDLSGNPAWRLFLADTVNGFFRSPITGGVQQSNDVRQSGGLTTLSGGFAVDLWQGVSLGGTILGTFGQYRYQRIFSETDTQNRYNMLDSRNFTNVDYAGLDIQETIIQEVAGLSGIVGLQARVGDNVRVGASVGFPTAFTVTENNAWQASSAFDDGDRRDLSRNVTGRFTVITPWRFGGGISAHFQGLTLSGGAEYSDFKSLRMNTQDSRTTGTLLQLANNVLAAQLRWGVAAEYDFANQPFCVRGSYSFIGSPYLDTSLLGEIQQIAFGGGVYIAPNIRADLTARFFQRGYRTTLYGDQEFNGSQLVIQAAAQVVWRL